MLDLLLSNFALGAAGAVALFGVYRAIRDKWPAYYYPVKTAAQALLRQNLATYCMFGLIPVLVVSLFVTVTSDRFHERNPWIALTACLGLFLMGSLVKTFLVRPVFRINLLVTYVLSVTLTGIAGVSAYILRTRLAWAVPQPIDMVNAVWTAAIAAIAYFGLTYLLSNEGRVEVDVFDRAKSDVGPAWDYCASAAALFRCDPAALRAIVMAEAVQRPRWLRRIEFRLQCAGEKMGRRATTGVAQINSLKPLTDEQSIDILASRLSRRPHSTASGLREFVRNNHNPDAVLIEDSVKFFELVSRD